MSDSVNHEMAFSTTIIADLRREREKLYEILREHCDERKVEFGYPLSKETYRTLCVIRSHIEGEKMVCDIPDGCPLLKESQDETQNNL